MGYALTSVVEERPAPVTVPPGLEADLCCLMCGRMVGEIIRGRAVQHRGCTGRLRLERGMIRCCHCNGAVYREPLAPLTME